ncbi:MAG: alpha-N-arabinofuranosidase [Anaerolineae bacterium]|nr:MAG: alpha-N-arabinofuranosidase [Anaerolineae bacterium]
MLCALLILFACVPVSSQTLPGNTPEATSVASAPTEEPVMDIFKKPLVTHIYTADPSAHVFEGKIYIYPSHDLDHDNLLTANNDGDQFDMEDYHVFSMENMHTLPVDHGEVLNVKDVPWASKQMWAPDAAFKNGTYYLYFPARDKQHIFRIGVATSKSPAGPFTPESSYIEGSFSIDPCVFIDDDGQAYIIFGGLMGGQLEKWQTGQFDPHGVGPKHNEPALGPRIARLAADMLRFDGPVQEILLLDEDKTPILAGEGEKRFFEASWMHKYNGVYYFSYSTGTGHQIAYAIGDKPTGPFVFKGYVLNPVTGWTTHHSIVEFQGKWYLFYHDATLSGGVDYKRNIKVAELTYNPDGTIQTIEP